MTSRIKVMADDARQDTDEYFGEILESVRAAVSILKEIMFIVTEKCRFFLDIVIGELQYGNTIEYLMEEIRNNVEKKLAKLDETISHEMESIPGDLSSPSPVGWTKVVIHAEGF